MLAIWNLQQVLRARDRPCRIEHRARGSPKCTQQGSTWQWTSCAGRQQSTRATCRQCRGKRRSCADLIERSWPHRVWLRWGPHGRCATNQQQTLWPRPSSVVSIRRVLKQLEIWFYLFKEIWSWGQWLETSGAEQSCVTIVTTHSKISHNPIGN